MTWAPDYSTGAVLQSYLRNTIDADLSFCQQWVTAASRNIDDFTHRQFGKTDTAQARVYRTTWDRHVGAYVGYIDDTFDAALTVATAAGAAVTDFELGPDNAFVRGKPFTTIATSAAGKLTITANPWGWPSIPPSVVTGLQLQAGRLAARRDSPFGIAGSPNIQGGNEMRLFAQLDPDFRITLKPYVREWWAA